MRDQNQSGLLFLKECATVVERGQNAVNQSELALERLQFECGKTK